MTTVEAFEGGWRDAARSDGIRAQEITMMAESIQRRLEAVLTATTPGEDDDRERLLRIGNWPTGPECRSRRSATTSGWACSRRLASPTGGGRSARTTSGS